MVLLTKPTRKRYLLPGRVFAAAAWLGLGLFFIGAVHGVVSFDCDDCNSCHVDDEHHEPDTPSPARNGVSDCGFCELMHSPALAFAGSSLRIPFAASASYTMPESQALHLLRDWRPGSQRDPPIDSFK